MKRQPFDLEKPCPKCGGDDLNLSYCNEGRPFDLCYDPAYSRVREHHHRNCNRCHYEWLMRMPKVSA